MARKKRQEEHVNHERWLVSYADFITLLFAFFVVMYAVSSVNEGKYRVLSDTLEAAFDPAGAFQEEQRSLNPIQVGEVAKTDRNDNIQLHKEATNALDNESSPASTEDIIDTEQLNKTIQAIDTMADELDDALSPEIQSDLVNIKRNELWLEIEINSSLLFKSGSANISRKAVPVIRDIAKILRPFPNKIHVEGFTDNVPINNPVYPSNWELSAARAASVVRLLAGNGMEPDSMAAIGYGEFRPIADNNTKAGRMKNRRVVLIVLAAGNYEAANPDQASGFLMNDLQMRGQGSPDLDRAVQELPLRRGP
jgi:chemotaxis protein MotB